MVVQRRAEGRGPGRPVKSRAETRQGAALATWLREQLTRGLSVQELADRFAFGRSTWAEFRNGGKLIPGWLLEDVVRDLVREPRLRQQMLKQGRELLNQAELAAAGRLPEETAALPDEELRERLKEARQARADAQRTLVGTYQLVVLLLGLTASLNARYRDLQDAADSEERELCLLRLEKYELQLDAARAARDEAEDLRLEAVLQAERYRQAVSGPPMASFGLQLRDADEHVAHDEHERLWAANERYLRQARRALDGVRSRLDVPPADPAGIVRGQLADPELSPGQPPDPADAADEKEADRPPAWVLIAGGVLLACVVVPTGYLGLTGQTSRGLIYSSGARPAGAEHPANGMGGDPDRTQYGWEVRDTVTSTFRMRKARWPVTVLGGTLKGGLEARFHGACSAATITWRFLADGRQVRHGALTPVSPRPAQIQVNIDGRTKAVTLIVGWGQRPTGCESFNLTLDDPQVTAFHG